MLKVGVLISGGGTNLQSLIDAQKDNKLNAEISCVISNRKDAYGLTRAKENDIPAYFLSKKDYNSNEDYDREIVRIFKENGVSLIVLAGYLNILTDFILNEFEDRIINIHPSLLPLFGGKGFYGEHVHKAVLESGVKISGATVHFVKSGVDEGPILIQESVPVYYSDSIETLQKRVLEIEHKLLPKAVYLISKDCVKINGKKVEVLEDCK